jgi:hypothetical protein
MVTYMNRNQIPFLKTEPLHAVFRSKARMGQIVAGFYDFALVTDPAQPTPNGTNRASPRVDLDPDNLYIIDYFTFSANIGEDDYADAIVDDTAAAGTDPGLPRFHLYVESELGGPILKQPIPLPQYYQDAPYPKWRDFSKEASDNIDTTSIVLSGMKSTNQLQGAFEGRFAVTPALAGKQIITLTLAFGMLEIRDMEFIRQYKAHVEKPIGA